MTCAIASLSQLQLSTVTGGAGKLMSDDVFKVTRFSAGVGATYGVIAGGLTSGPPGAAIGGLVGGIGGAVAGYAGGSLTEKLVDAVAPWVTIPAK